MTNIDNLFILQTWIALLYMFFFDTSILIWHVVQTFIQYGPYNITHVD